LSHPERQGIVKFVIGRVGVTGLGNKRHVLAANLVEDGYRVRVFDRNRERIMAMESTDAMERGPF
jgi:3-hydroxyisobutyrate dehydrogenase-like beta-hydroxyacid dehydrogenase